MSFGTVYKDGKETRRDTRWGLEGVGLSREGAIANMAMRAIRHVEWLGTVFLEEILDGRADPEKPYLINDENTGIYIWFCIVREDQQPPALPEGRS